MLKLIIILLVESCMQVLRVDRHLKASHPGYAPGAGEDINVEVIPIRSFKSEFEIKLHLVFVLFV